MGWKRRTESNFVLQAERDQQAISEAMEELRLDDGSILKVLDVGSGDPIILIPMITELNFLYAPQVKEFSADHRVILYEPRLSRRSRFGMADRAREVVLLMKTLGLESAHIVAWSDAGAAAYSLAKLWPDKCLSVVFLGLPDRYRPPQPFHFLMKLLWRLPLETLAPSFMFAHILARFMKGPKVKHSWVVQYARRIPELPRLFKHSCLPNLIQHKPMLAEVEVPSLVICGDSDQLVSCEQAQRMTKLLPRANKTVIITGGEHCLVYVNADAVNCALRQFYMLLRQTSS